VSSPWEAPSSPLDDGAPVGDGIPWESQQSLRNLFLTVKVLLLSADRSFRAAGPALSVAPAFIFAFALGSAFGLIGKLMGPDPLWPMLLATTQGWEAMAEAWQNAVTALGAVPLEQRVGLGDLLGTLAGESVGLVLNAALVHVGLLVMSGAKRGFDSTLRALAYARGATAFLYLIPVAGSFVGFGLSVYIGARGLARLHGIAGGRAYLAILGPYLIAVLVVVLWAGLGR